MQNYRELIVWQKSMDLAEEIYTIVKKLPREENYVLSDQMRRAAISIPSNIAEGFGRKTNREYIRFLNIAKGSKNELETQILICVRLKFLKQKEIEHLMSLCDEIGKMLNALIKKLTEN